MKRLLLAVLMIFMVTGIATAKDFEMIKKAGDYSLVVKIDKNPPVVGNNNLSLTVKDGMGTEIRDAKVAVKYSMPGMPGMPAMNYSINADWKGSEYKAKLDFSMPGGWNMVIKIIRGSKAAQAKFSIDVR
jgi:hypothetical protein